MSGSLRERVRSLLTRVLKEVQRDGLFEGEIPEISLDRPRRREHGDFATGVALALAKRAQKTPRAVAEDLRAKVLVLDSDGLLESAEIAGPGFLNLRLSRAHLLATVTAVRRMTADFGRSPKRLNEPRILLEFVSANPTGPLHLAHGRHAVLGDALGRLLEFAGYDVRREYYINDTGNQVRNLARSVWARYMEARGKSVEFPKDGYHGQYIREYASDLAREVGDRYESEQEPEDLEELRDAALEGFIGKIKGTLDRFGVRYDEFSRESKLHDTGAVARVIDVLKRSNHTFESEGAIWLRTSELVGDERDRVIVKRDGSLPYITADVAYHADKLDRGFDRLIDVWGADHHGHIPGIRAGLKALGRDPEAFEVLLVQIVKLLRGGQEIKMSKRTGELVTLDEVLDEVGADATRYFFLSRRHDAAIDFDLDIAKAQTLDNPVYYVQYAHARCAAILRRAAELHPPLRAELENGEIDLTPLAHEDELAIVKILADYPEDVAEAAKALEPHRLIYFASELAKEFQSYFTRLQKVHGDTILPQERQRQGNWQETWDWPKTRARLAWVDAIRIVLASALGLCGINAPVRMDATDSSRKAEED